jgi:putative membrane protein
MSTKVLATRSLFGGLLMGLANLVPGISGGTMLLAVGIYEIFIESIADMTRFRLRFRSLLVLGCVVAAAAIGIVLLAGLLKDLVLDHRWIMYSLFIGLTLGGLPVVWNLARPVTNSLWISAAISFAAMVCLAVLQLRGVVGSGDSNPVTLFSAGLVGASAMILPGLSGGYLLLLLGQYVPILSAIDQFKEAIRARDINAAFDPALTVLLPVGVGVIVGVVLIGNLLKWLFHHHRQMTLGILVGLLLGSVAGLWPFQEGIPPEIGDLVKGQIVTAESIVEIEKEDWPIKLVRPSVGLVVGSVCLVGLGYGVTQAIASIGSSQPTTTQENEPV